MNWFTAGRNFLVYTGCPGAGKTYFCYALLNYIKDSSLKRTYRYWNERSLLSKVRASMEETKGDFRDQLKNLTDDHFLIIDDLGSSGYTDWRRDTIFDLIDIRYESTLPTVFTSNLNRDQMLSTFGERAHGRLFATENTFLESYGTDYRQSSKNNG